MPDFVILIFAIILMVAPLELGKHYKSRKLRTAKATGKVKTVRKEINPSMSSESLSIPTNHPVVEFEYHQKKYHFTSSIGNSWSTPIIGDEAVVCFDPKNPKNAEVECSKLVGFLGWTVPFYGLPIIGVGLLVYWLIK